MTPDWQNGKDVHGRDVSPKRPRGKDGIGRDGSPSRPMGKDRSSNGPILSGGFGETTLPKREILNHDVPPWVPEGATFFITINSLPRGQNQMAIPAVANALMESITTRIERGQWWPHLVLFMPDHLHALMVFPADQNLPKGVRDWKRYTARNTGIRWQRDFFDHRIRNEQSLEERWHYVLQNPVRAGLVSTPEDWPYVWIGRDGSGRDGIGRDGSPSRPIIGPVIGRTVSPKRPMGRDGIGRDGSPSRPIIGRDVFPSRPKDKDRSPNGPQLKNNGAFGETALPEDME